MRMMTKGIDQPLCVMIQYPPTPLSIPTSHVGYYCITHFIHPPLYLDPPGDEFNPQAGGEGVSGMFGCTVPRHDGCARDLASK